MALSTDKRIWKFLIAIFLILTTIMLLLFYFSSIFIPFIVGVVMIIISEKLIKDYKKRMDKYKLSNFNRKLYGYGMLFFWIIITIFLIGNSLSEFGDVIESVGNQTVGTAYLTKINRYIPPGMQNYISTDKIFQSVKDYTFSLFTDFFASMGSFIFNGILIIPIMFYMYFKRRKDITKKLLAALPKNLHHSFSFAAKKISSDLHHFLSAKVIESTVVGGICCFGFFVAGVKGWLILGVLAGFLNIVPYLGPFIGAIPPLLITILVEEPIIVLYVFITILIAQLVDNLYIIPFMISSKVKMDPLLSIVLILVGARLFGPLGMIFAIPVYLIYKIVLRETYCELAKVCKY